MEKEPFDIEAAIRDVQAMVDRHDAKHGWTEAKLGRQDDLLTTMVHMLTRLEKNQDAHSQEFKSIDARFQSIDARFQSIDARFERLEAKVDLRFDQMQSDFRAFKEVLLDHSRRIQALEKRVS